MINNLMGPEGVLYYPPCDVSVVYIGHVTEIQAASDSGIAALVIRNFSHFFGLALRAT